MVEEVEEVVEAADKMDATNAGVEDLTELFVNLLVTIIITELDAAVFSLQALFLLVFLSSPSFGCLLQQSQFQAAIQLRLQKTLPPTFQIPTTPPTPQGLF